MNIYLVELLLLLLLLFGDCCVEYVYQPKDLKVSIL